MSEETTSTATQSVSETPPESANGSIPKARFDEINERMKAAEALVATNTANADAARQAELVRKGEFETLTTEMQGKLEAAEAKAVKLDAYEATRRTALTANLSDEDKAAFGEMPLDQLEALVTRLNGQTPPAVVKKPAASSASGAELTREAIRAMTPGERKARSAELADYYQRLTS